MRLLTALERPCFACGHLHDPESPGACWEAECLPECPAHEGDNQDAIDASVAAHEVALAERTDLP